MQQLYNEIGSYLDHRIDTPPLDIPSSQQKLPETDTDYLNAPHTKSSLYLQAAPGSTFSVHSSSSPVPSPTHSESLLSRRQSGASERAESPSSCVCFRCKNSSRPSSISSSYDQSLTCACYKCEKAKQKTFSEEPSSRHSSFSYSDQHLTQPNMTQTRQSLYRWDDENEDPVERFQSPVTSALDEIQQELRYTQPSTFLSKASSYHSYEDPNDAAEGLDEEIREPLKREGSAQSLLEPVMRIRDTLQQQAIDSIDGMSSVADDSNPTSPPAASHQQLQARKTSSNSIPQPNIIPNRLSCLTAYYRNGPPHKALNMHQIKRIPQRRDRMNEYEIGYYDCIQSRTDLNAWLRKQEVKGPPDVMFEFSPPERKSAKRSFFIGKKAKPSASVDHRRLTNMTKNKSTLSPASVVTAEVVHRGAKAQSPTSASPVKGKRWSGLFKGSPFTKKEGKESQQKAQAMKRNSFYSSPTGSVTSSLDEEGFSKRKDGHNRHMSEPWHDGYKHNSDSKLDSHRRISNEEFELASQFDQWQLHERGRTELRTPVEEQDEEDDEIAYFTPDGRLSTSPAKYQSPSFAPPDGDNTRPLSHSQISLLSVPSIGYQHHGRSSHESESSHSHQSLQENDYMDMEEALDNLSSTFRTIDQDVLRQILEEADGDYQLAASQCKKAIFEGRL